MNIALLKVLYNVKRRPLGAFFDLMRYERFLRQADIKLRDGNIRQGINTVLFLDKGNKIVYRCSLNRFGYSGILNNYDFLRNARMSSIPRAIGLWERNGIALSAESLLEHKSLKTQDIDPGITSDIFSQLSKDYKRNIVRVKFDPGQWLKRYDYLLPCYNPLWSDRLKELKDFILQRSEFSGKHIDRDVCYTYIHGDLTFRNIMLNEEGFDFFDFDRAEVNFPEFDLFLFCLDALTHKEESVTYEDFFGNIIKFVKGNMGFPEIDAFYDSNPDFIGNRKYINDIKSLFLYRMLIVLLQFFNPKDKRPLSFLERAINEVF